MHIGLDLDNTLVGYDRVFAQAAQQQGLLPQGWQGGKQKLRKLLRSRERGDEDWQLLQGQVYGALMYQAELMPGAGWFLLHCRAKDVRVSVVSHKTRYSPKDPERVPLREMALCWMTNKGFFDPDRFGISPESVYFEDTREQKVKRIAALGCTHFVDDLLEVFSEPEFPIHVARILFGTEELGEDLNEGLVSCSDWALIGSMLLGCESEQDLTAIAQGLMPELAINRCQSVAGGGNSRVYHLLCSGREPLAFKRYPTAAGDSRDRLGTETKACNFLRAQGAVQVAAVAAIGEENHVAAFEWVKGERLDAPNHDDLSQLIEFVSQLDSLRHKKGARTFTPASEACFSGQEIVRQIQFRRDRLEQLAVEFPGLLSYLRQDFDPIFGRLRNWARHNWPTDQTFNGELPTQYRTLSPSDLGFHNALRAESGALRIIDLEYFGWDDPVKLTSDFCWHPGMTLDQRMRDEWIRAAVQIFTRDRSFMARLRAAYPLYGLRWAMIVLNPFLMSPLNSSVPTRILNAQLEKSTNLCRKAALLIEDERYSF